MQGERIVLVWVLASLAAIGGPVAVNEHERFDNGAQLLAVRYDALVWDEWADAASRWGIFSPHVESIGLVQLKHNSEEARADAEYAADQSAGGPWPQRHSLENQ